MFWRHRDKQKQSNQNEDRLNPSLRASTTLQMDSSLPGYLLRPSDPLSQRFFGSSMLPVVDERCGYRAEVYGECAGQAPWIEKRTTGFEIDEVHIYYKKEAPSWYAISTMKTPSVRTSPLCNAVLAPYNLSKVMDTYEPVLNVPDAWDISDYESFGLSDLGAWPAYDRARGLEESHVFCHIFRMNGRLCKDFILMARKGIFSWKLECIIEASEQEISPADFVPPGYFFGSFEISDSLSITIAGANDNN